MRQNGVGTTTIEDARIWLEETGLCLFMPQRQFSPFVVPSFVEAVAGQRNLEPSAKLVSQAEDLLVRLETNNVAVRLNLQGQPGEQPDFVVAAWVLPYVYALRGDRDWRRTPQLTGSRQVSPLAIQTYKLLEADEATIPQLRHALGREVSESAVLRAITELWQQLRIIPVVSAPGRTPQWQLLKIRYQKAIAEGASTSQVTAISVLASIYLQAVIAATMEEVELYLAPLTARSKVREVLRGLVATRQVHTLSLGHAPHFYVAGTLPEFTQPPTIYASSAMPASSYFLNSFDREEELHEPLPAVAASASIKKPTPPPVQPTSPALTRPTAEKPAKPRFSRPASGAHKPAPRPSNGHGSRDQVASRSHNGAVSTSTSRVHHSGGNHSGGNHSNNHSNHTAGVTSLHKAKPAAARSLHNNHGKPAAKSAARPTTRGVSAAHKSARPVSASRKPAMAAAKSGGRSRFGFAAHAKSPAKKRG
jgi:hypothetical protein